MIVMGLVWVVMLSGAYTGPNLAPVGLLVSAAGALLIVFYSVKSKRDIPALQADRHGFRIRGGRLRPWRTYFGVNVSTISSEGAQMGKTVSIKVSSRPIFNSRKVASYYYSSADRAESVANEIFVFKKKLDTAWAAEGNRLDLGPVPVVAARERRMRHVTPRFWRHSFWRRIGGRRHR